MAVSAIYRVKGEVVGQVSGSVVVDPGEKTISSAIGQRQIISLNSGANTITVPTGATVVLIVPPTENTNSLTLKGVSGDTGVALSKTLPTALTLASVSSFVLSAGGTTSMEFTYL